MGCSPTQCRFLSRGSHLLLSLDGDGTVREVDAGHPEVLDRPATEVVGAALAALVAPDQRRHLARVLARCETGQAVWDELVFAAADGSPRPMLCCFQPMGTGNGDGSLLLTALDRSALEAKARAEAAAVMAHLALGLHRPAHRLMQALAVVESEPPCARAADTCRGEVRALLETVSRASAWADFDAPAGSVADAVAVVEATVHQLEADEAFAGLSVELEAGEASLPAAVHPVGLACAVMHAAAAARDATARTRDGRLRIRLHRENGRVVLELADNGAGLDREHAACAFTPCETCGGGLDLAACADLVRTMGGTIRLHSRPRQGSTLILTFPAVARA